MTVRILKGDCRDVLRTLPDESVHCVVTSPPYFGLRDYGAAGQIGLEATPDAFVSELVDVFAELRRVLRKDGTAWLNLGDSYAGGGHGGGGSFEADRDWRPGNPEKNKGNSNRDGLGRITGLNAKNLIGIPWRVAFALQADGWYLRQDIIWSKPNPMPESARDRCTKAHEYIFLLSKSGRYYFDQESIAEPVSETAGAQAWRKIFDPTKQGKEAVLKAQGMKGGNDGARNAKATHRNKRSIWEISTQPFSEAHFATFPPALIEPCILAGCPKQCCTTCGAPWVREVERREFDQSSNEVIQTNGVPGLRPGTSGDRVRKLSGATYQHVRGKTLGFSPSCSCNAGTVGGAVLDPFGGAGTTGLVADRLGRNAILIELNPDYAAMADRRIRNDVGMFADVTTSPPAKQETMPL
jgi:DNA modification methylase